MPPFPIFFYVFFTEMVKVSGHVPPAISVVTAGPWVVKDSKSSLKKHTAEIDKSNCVFL